jgi:predicted DNA-binding protein
MAVIERSIEKSLAEMDRILAAASLEHERCGDESHEHFVVRKVLEASGLPDQLRGAVEALEHLASPNWKVRPTGADAQAMAGFAVDALARLRGGQSQ